MTRRKIIQVGNICALCEEIYPRSVLFTCSRCGLIYCGNCVLFEGGVTICLRCAAKRVTPKARESKYMRLSNFLAKRAKALNEITISFQKIEEIIGDKLPESAYARGSWWSNVRGRIPSEAWLTVGWAVKEVDLKGRKVTFVKENSQEKMGERQETRDDRQSFKILALKARARARTKKLSKTKIAILQARLKNIEKQRQMEKEGRLRNIK
ncbi:MAG: hypothetical protein QXL85_01315 [Candidatus Bathyarchaeia archaeon]